MACLSAKCVGNGKLRSYSNRSKMVVITERLALCDPTPAQSETCSIDALTAWFLCGRSLNARFPALPAFGAAFRFRSWCWVGPVCTRWRAGHNPCSTFSVPLGVARLAQCGTRLAAVAISRGKRAQVCSFVCAVELTCSGIFLSIEEPGYVVPEC